MLLEINKKTLQRIFLGAAGCILLYWLLHETDRVKSFFGVVSDIAAPFVIGGVLAFILNVPMRGIENALFGKIKKSKLLQFVIKVKKYHCFFIRFSVLYSYCLFPKMHSPHRPFIFFTVF